MKKNKKSLHLSLVILTIMGTAFGCKKTADDKVLDANNISNVVADNFNLSIFNTVLKYSSQDKVVKANGPFTILAPSDAAFSGVYNNPEAVVNAGKTTISKLAQYHILDGRYDLNKLPFSFNQELRSHTGKLFVTRWVNNGDTIITINGARVLARNIPASNGLIQVTNRVLTPYVHDKLGSALAAEPSLTVFYQAMVSSGVLNTINNAGPYTIFAPNNDAMRAAGYATVAQVSDANPEELKLLVNHHIVRDRRFVYDYILSANATINIKQNMLDGYPVYINLLQDAQEPGTYNSITLGQKPNEPYISVVQRDLLAGNGVIHIIDNAIGGF